MSPENALQGNSFIPLWTENESSKVMSDIITKVFLKHFHSVKWRIFIDFRFPWKHCNDRKIHFLTCHITAKAVLRKLVETETNVVKRKRWNSFFLYLLLLIYWMQFISISVCFSNLWECLMHGSHSDFLEIMIRDKRVWRMNRHNQVLKRNYIQPS